MNNCAFDLYLFSSYCVCVCAPERQLNFSWYGSNCIHRWTLPCAVKVTCQKWIIIVKTVIQCKESLDFFPIVFPSKCVFSRFYFAFNVENPLAIVSICWNTYDWKKIKIHTNERHQSEHEMEISDTYANYGALSFFRVPNKSIFSHDGCVLVFSTYFRMNWAIEYWSRFSELP